MIIFLVLSLCFFSTSIEAAIIDTVEVKEAEIHGMFDVILYGGRHSDDLETIALLVPLNSDYQVKMFAPDFDYRVERKVSAETALNMSKRFTGWHVSFMRHIFLKLIAPNGKTIAFEVRPLYLPFVYGRADVFDNNYWLKDNTFYVAVKLLPSIERRLYHFDFNHSSN